MIASKRMSPRRTNTQLIYSSLDITLIFRKEDLLNKENYRHISVLPKKYLKYLKDYYLINLYLSPLLRGFRKGHDTQVGTCQFTSKVGKIS